MKVDGPMSRGAKRNRCLPQHFSFLNLNIVFIIAGLFSLFVFGFVFLRTKDPAFSCCTRPCKACSQSCLGKPVLGDTLFKGCVLIFFFKASKEGGNIAEHLLCVEHHTQHHMFHFT